MTLNFQNRIVFPAPESSYTTQSAFGQVIYLPRDIMKQVEKKLSKAKLKSTSSSVDGGLKEAKTVEQSLNAAEDDLVTHDEEEERDAAFLRKSQDNIEKKALQAPKHQDPVIMDSDTLIEDDEIKPQAQLSNEPDNIQAIQESEFMSVV